VLTQQTAASVLLCQHHRKHPRCDSYICGVKGIPSRQKFKYRLLTQFQSFFFPKLINKLVKQINEQAQKQATNEIKVGTPNVIVLWQRTLKTLAQIELLVVRLLRATLLMAGCLKRAPNGD
jgi:hypothetical protein